MFQRTKLPSWNEDALKIHQGNLRENFSQSFPMGHGHNRYQKKGMDQEVRSALLDQRKDEIIAFAEDQGIDVNLVFSIAEAAMRLGKIPEMGSYGLSENDAWAVGHFIADAVLNTAHEDEEKINNITEALSAGSAMRVEVPYSMSGEFAMMATSARGVSKVMPHGMARGKKATLYVFFRNKGDAKGQAGHRVREMAKSLGGKIMEGKSALKAVQADVTKHMEMGKTAKKAAHDAEMEGGLKNTKVHDHGKVVAYEDMDCEQCIDEAKGLDAKLKAWIDQYGKKDVTRMALALGYAPSAPEFLAALQRVIPGKEQAIDTYPRKSVEEEFLANPGSMDGTSKPSQLGFASPFPWSDSSRGRDFIKPKRQEEEKKPKTKTFGIGPGSQGNPFFRM